MGSDLPSTKFRKVWETATSDNDLTLYGFRRFKTTHLLNLRYLEEELAEIDHTLYQAGLSVGIDHSPRNRLGLEHCQKDAAVPRVEHTITDDLIRKARGLVREYDEALIAFHQVMTMEVFSLIDDQKQSSLRTDLTLPEIYKTRLLRVDLGPRTRTDPIQDWIHRWLRDFRYRRLLSLSQGSAEGINSSTRAGAHSWSYQDAVFISSIIGRFITTLISGAFIVVPLLVLSPKSSATQSVIIGVCIAFFSFLIALALKVSNFEMIAISAAYAAVISVLLQST